MAKKPSKKAAMMAKFEKSGKDKKEDKAGMKQKGFVPFGKKKK